jgi:D-sedoheptulose 7-phosphate isomerase
MCRVVIQWGSRENKWTKTRVKNNIVQFAQEYTENLSVIMSELDFSVIAKIIEIFESARNHSKKIFFIGNGGSAATASHFANDLATVSVPLNEPLFKALCLADSVAALTALGNDTGYENVFTGQLKNLLEPNDVLVALSASGNSPNIIRAVEYTNDHGGTTVGLGGFDGGKLKNLCHAFLHVATARGAYGPVEDIHMMMDHLITSYLRSIFVVNQTKTHKLEKKP